MSAVEDSYQRWAEEVAVEFARHAPDPTSQDEPESEDSE